MATINIPEKGKFINKENYENVTNFIIHDHHVIKNSTVTSLDKLTPTEIIAIILIGKQSLCYHALSRIIPTYNIFDKKS